RFFNFAMSFFVIQVYLALERSRISCSSVVGAVGVSFGDWAKQVWKLATVSVNDRNRDFMISMCVTKRG
ncbi:MAG TPA: hypothetical protein VGA56_24600, partial [Opitutaceae bacterium]